MLMEPMDAFSPNPPDWTNEAIHAHTFACPQCGASEKEAKEVWLNRYAPVQMNFITATAARFGGAGAMIGLLMNSPIANLLTIPI
jgi:hypothetical protein